MFTVRYPNGQAVQYNTAGFLKYNATVWEIYTKDPEKGGSWVASIQISAGAIVECVRACDVYDAPTRKAQDQIAQLTKEVRSIKRKLGKKT